MVKWGETHCNIHVNVAVESTRTPVRCWFVTTSEYQLTFQITLHIGNGVIGTSAGIDMDARKPDLLQLGNVFAFFRQSRREFVWYVPQRGTEGLAAFVESQSMVCVLNI
jgi:hypothetical protein